MKEYVSPNTQLKLQLEGNFLVGEKDEKFPIINGIPRFVNSDNYAAAFGLEWTIHSKTQLDSFTRANISKERLERCLGFSLSKLKGKDVFEGGCGAGRFTELLVKSGANVHSIDLSSAVDVNKNNIGNRENYKISQASLTEPPFRENSFDVAICIGVIQHTPSPEKSIEVLYSLVKPGGLLVIDHYTWSLSFITKLAPLYRLFLKNMDPERSKRITDKLVKAFFPLHWATRKFRPGQMLLSRISPLLFYYRMFPQLIKEQHYEFSQLDTYDHLTDYYKHIRTVGQIKKHLKQLGAEKIEVWKGGNGVEAKCRKPIKK